MLKQSLTIECLQTGISSMLQGFQMHQSNHFVKNAFKNSTVICDYKSLVTITFSLCSNSSKIASTINWRSSTRMDSLLSCGSLVFQGSNSRDSFLKDLCKSFKKREGEPTYFRNCLKFFFSIETGVFLFLICRKHSSTGEVKVLIFMNLRIVSCWHSLIWKEQSKKYYICYILQFQ